MIKIKVCGLTDANNAKEIAEAKPDIMGFIFYPGSIRYVGADPEPALFKSVPAGIQKAGVFVNEDIDKIIIMAQKAGLDLIQLHGNESVEYCGLLHASGMKIIKAFSLSESADIEFVKPYSLVCDYFLFDTKTEGFGGSGKKFSWDILTEYNLKTPFFLSGGIGPEDVEELSLLRNRSLFAIDLNSRFEDVPGMKNVGLVKTFIDEYKKICHEL